MSGDPVLTLDDVIFMVVVVEAMLRRGQSSDYRCVGGCVCVGVGVGGRGGGGVVRLRRRSYKIKVILHNIILYNTALAPLIVVLKRPTFDFYLPRKSRK